MKRWERLRRGNRLCRGRVAHPQSAATVKDAEGTHNLGLCLSIKTTQEQCDARQQLGGTGSSKGGGGGRGITDAATMA